MNIKKKFDQSFSFSEQSRYAAPKDLMRSGPDLYERCWIIWSQFHFHYISKRIKLGLRSSIIHKLYWSKQRLEHSDGVRIMQSGGRWFEFRFCWLPSLNFLNINALKFSHCGLASRVFLKGQSQVQLKWCGFESRCGTGWLAKILATPSVAQK